MKTFRFNREGLNQCMAYTDYKEIAKEMLENNPQILPMVLIGVLGLSIFLISPGASQVAYKASLDDTTSIIAFKFLGGF